MNQSPTPAPRFLVVRLRRLGDIIVSEPVIRALRRSHPEAAVDIVVQSEFSEIVRHNPDIGRTLLFDRAWDKAPLKKRLGHYQRFIGELRAFSYDAVIDLHSNPRSIMIAYLARAKARIGRRKIHNLFFTRRLAALPGPVQTSRQLLHLLSPLGLDGADPNPELFVPAETEEKVAERFGLEKKGFVVICPGSNKPYWTRWAPENFAHVALHAASKRNMPVYVVTGPNEGELARFFREKTAHSAMVQVIENRLSQIELAAFIKLAALFAGNNSGPLHMAGALHTPAIGVYGPSLPDTWAVPDTTPHRHFFRMVGCNPCGESSCGFTPRKCLEAVSPEEVCRGLDELLDEAALA